MAAKRKTTADVGPTLFMVVPKLQAIFGTREPGAIGSRELVAYALRFLNGDETRHEPAAELVAGEPFLQPDTLPGTRESWRRALRQFVTTFRSSRAAAIRSLPEYSLPVHGISGVARFEDGRGRFEVIVPINLPEEFRTMLALTLSDDAQPFGRALCRCRLKSCGRFFLEQKPRTGRPQRLYCSREHMLAAHAARER